MPHDVLPPTTPRDDDRFFTDLQALYTAPKVPDALQRNGAAEVRQRFAASRANGSPRARWFVSLQGERPPRSTAVVAIAATMLICLLAVALFRSNLSGTSSAGGVGLRATPDHAQATQTTQAYMGIPPLSLSSVAMISASDGWAFGSSLKYGCVVLHYDGASWQRSVGSACAAVKSISMVSADDGWALATAYGDSQTQEILHFTRGSWQVQATFPVPTTATPQVDWPQQWYNLRSIAMTSPTDGWAVGWLQSVSSDYTDDRALILRYARGHWTPTPVTGLSPAHGALLTGISMVSANEGWAVGYDYEPSLSNDQSYMLVLHYLNGTWSRVAWTHAGALNGVDALPTGDIWAVGTADMGQTSAVIHLHDGVFVSLLEPVPGSLNAVQIFSNPAGERGWAVGDGAATVHDQGGAWTRIGYTIHQFTISSISLLSPTEGWAVGQTAGANAYTSPDWAATLFHLHNGVWSIYPTTGI